jgi:TctA family transporter
VFGVVGYLMDKYRYSRANFVIGMVLAVMIERNLHISLNLYGNDFLLDRPIALAMLVFVLVTAALPFWRQRRRMAAARAGGAA